MIWKLCFEKKGDLVITEKMYNVAYDNLWQKLCIMVICEWRMKKLVSLLDTILANKVNAGIYKQ